MEKVMLLIEIAVNQIAHNKGSTIFLFSLRICKEKVSSYNQPVT